MHTNSTAYAYKDTKVSGYVLDVPGGGRTAYLQIGGDEGRVTFILMGADSTDFLDKLANEAERLTREFIGDVPPLEPLAPSQAYLDEIGEMQTAELHGGPEVA